MDAQNPRKPRKGAAEEEQEGETYYDAMKLEMGGRAAKTRSPNTNFVLFYIIFFLMIISVIKLVSCILQEWSLAI